MTAYEHSNSGNQKALAEARDLSEQMLKIAEKGFLACNDDSCLLVYGIILDCSYKIRRTVEQEQQSLGSQQHRQRIIH